MPVQIDGRGGYDSFALTSRPTGVMLLTRRQPFYPSAAHDKFRSVCTAFGGYTEFGIAPRSFLYGSKCLEHFSNILKSNGFIRMKSLLNKLS